MIQFIAYGGGWADDFDGGWVEIFDFNFLKLILSLSLKIPNNQ
jgi:hypothetical protein